MDKGKTGNTRSTTKKTGKSLAGTTRKKKSKLAHVRAGSPAGRRQSPMRFVAGLAEIELDDLSVRSARHPCIGAKAYKNPDIKMPLKSIQAFRIFEFQRLACRKSKDVSSCG